MNSYHVFTVGVYYTCMTLTVSDLMARLRNANAQMGKSQSLLPARTCIDIIVKSGPTRDNKLKTPFVFSLDGKSLVPLHVLDTEILETLRSDDACNFRIRVSELARLLNVDEKIVHNRCSNFIPQVECILADVVLLREFFEYIAKESKSIVELRGTVSVAQVASELDLPTALLLERIVRPQGLTVKANETILVSDKFSEIATARVTGILKGIVKPISLSDVSEISGMTLETVQQAIDSMSDRFQCLVSFQRGLLIPKAYIQEQASLATALLEANGWCSIGGLNALAADYPTVKEFMKVKGYVDGQNCLVCKEYFVLISDSVTELVLSSIEQNPSRSGYIDVRGILMGKLPLLRESEWSSVMQALVRRQCIPMDQFNVRGVIVYPKTLPETIVQSMNDSIQRALERYPEMEMVSLDSKIVVDLIQKGSSVLEKQYKITNSSPSADLYNDLLSEIESKVLNEVRARLNARKSKLGRPIAETAKDRALDETALSEWFMDFLTAVSAVGKFEQPHLLLQQLVQVHFPKFYNRVAEFVGVRVCGITESVSDPAVILKALPSNLRESLQLIHTLGHSPIEAGQIQVSVECAKSGLRDFGIVISDKSIKAFKGTRTKIMKDRLVQELSVCTDPVRALQIGGHLWAMSKAGCYVVCMPDAPEQLVNFWKCQQAGDSVIQSLCDLSTDLGTDTLIPKIKELFSSSKSSSDCD